MENPMVTTQKEAVVRFITAYPGSSRREVTASLGGLFNSITARVAELIESGTLIENGTKVDTLTDRRVRRLYVAEENRK